MNRKRWLIPTAGFAIAAMAAAIAATNADAAVTPGAVAPAPAGVTAADEIAYLKSLTGNHMIARQQGGANSDPAQWNRKAHDITGLYPGIWGGDFGFSQNDIDNRQTGINEAKAEWATGSLPACRTSSSSRTPASRCSSVPSTR